MAKRKHISKEVKNLSAYLKKIRATERNPLVLENPVTITQTIDGRDLFDFVSITVRRLWHDRTTVVIEDSTGTTLRDIIWVFFGMYRRSLKSYKKNNLSYAT